MSVETGVGTGHQVGSHTDQRLGLLIYALIGPVDMERPTNLPTPFLEINAPLVTTSFRDYTSHPNMCDAAVCHFAPSRVGYSYADTRRVLWVRSP